MSKDALKDRLNKLPDKKWGINERFKIISDFLLSPLLPDLIELNNRLYSVKIHKNDGNSITHISIMYEKEKKSGILNKLIRLFSGWNTGLKVWCNSDGRMFICEYYKHSFFSVAENLKTAYYEKLHDVFNMEFVIVDKVK